MNILVVEDSVVWTGRYLTIFRDWDDCVFKAHNVEEANALIEDEGKKIDLLISDLYLTGDDPETAGLRVIARFDELRPAVPYLLCTDKPKPSQITEVNYLSKTSEDNYGFRRALRGKIDRLRELREIQLARSVIDRVAHEINNLATKISGPVDLALKDYSAQTPEPVRSVLQGVIDQSQQISQVIATIYKVILQSVPIGRHYGAQMLLLPTDEEHQKT